MFTPLERKPHLLGEVKNILQDPLEKGFLTGFTEKGFEFRLKLDDVCFSIDSEDSQFIEKLNATFIPFNDPCQPDITLHVKFITLTGEKTLEEEIQNATGNINSWKEFKGLEEMTDGYYYWHGKNIYVIFKEIAASFPRFYLFPLLLRTYYSLKQDKDASNSLSHVLLHAAGIVKDGRGYIFAGSSGSGKTTVSQFSANRWLVINDEMVLLSRIKGYYWVSGSPLKATYTSINVKAPLRTIFFLQPGNYTSLKRVKGVETVLKLAPLLAYPYDHSLDRFENLSKKISMASVLVNELSCYDMHFEMNDRFWKYIENLDSN